MALMSPLITETDPAHRLPGMRPFIFSLIPSLHSDKTGFFLPAGAPSILQSKGPVIFALISGENSQMPWLWPMKVREVM